ncbi:YwmB family TATA-box binding protein [Paenibacillus spongiae]|uniref:YwmB family TATA-box binding protein n=1 Tax=Paenibacillus spongiae TaxID=2909671 RepID=A0ABY5SBN8_9BACL|nr:YwmB family TATA-box binding protein [Paenibacillus spongiae]UVI31371.1 YwmB family TATA-box binding protein [Paenibacillus spongiae]
MPRTVETKRPRIRKQTGTLLAVIMLLALAGYALWSGKTTTGTTEPSDGESAIQHDFSAVWTWMEPELTGGSERGDWSFRFNGRWTMEQANEAAALLELTLEPSQDHAAGSGEAVYRGELELADYTLRMLLQIDSGTESADGGAGTSPSGDAVLLLQFPEGSLRSQIQEAVAKVEQAVRRANAQYEGSFAVRGEPKDKAATKRITRKAAAAVQEDYDDGHTASIAYASQKLKTSVMSGGKRINLQIAGVNGAPGTQPQIIVGVPLITGDYLEQD